MVMDLQRTIERRENIILVRSVFIHPGLFPPNVVQESVLTDSRKQLCKNECVISDMRDVVNVWCVEGEFKCVPSHIP
jgi:hypothetical protein